MTRDGWVVLAVALGVMGAAWWSGNNLLYLVAAPVWAVLLLALPVGAANLRGVDARRVLAAELYAGRDAAGKLLVHCPRRWMAAIEVHVLDDGTGAAGKVARVAPGSWATVPVRWRFGERGPARLSAVVLRSTFPFGFAEHRLRIRLAANVLVYPRPLPSVAAPWQAHGTGTEDDRQRGGADDFVEIRAYQPGDSLRRVHWPTTARLGQLLVVERAADRAPAVEVVVSPASSDLGWERELSRACGEILRALTTGHQVGLRIPAVGSRARLRLPPSRGGHWRRALLDALASAPRWSAGES